MMIDEEYLVKHQEKYEIIEMKNFSIHAYLIIFDNFFDFEQQFFSENHKRKNNQSLIFKVEISLD
jgi:hypothetical protein